MISIDGSNIFEFSAKCNNCANAYCRTAKNINSDRVRWKMYLKGLAAKPECIEASENGWYSCKNFKEKVRRR